MNDVSSIAMLSNYAVHKNPFKALQLTEKKDDSLEHDEWHDIRISAFNHDAYVVTIFYESARIEYGEVFLHRAKQFTFKLMQNIESAALSA